MIKHWTEKEIEFLKHNYVKLGRKKCSEILKRTSNAIHSKCLKLKIKHTKEETLQKQLLGNLKKEGEFTVNEKLFMDEINEITAYLLGFIWADGYLQVNKKRTGHILYRIRIGINREDGEYIKTLLDTTGKWNISYHKPKKGKEIMSFACANTILGKYLFENDYHSKSINSADKILSKIPDNLKHYWFLGLLDGDGCITIGKKTKIDFSGPYEQDWSFLINLFKKLNVSFSYRKGERIKENNKIYRFSSFSTNGRKNCLKLGNYLYQEINLNKIGFQRKFNKFLSIIQDIKNIVNNSNIKNQHWKNIKPEIIEMINKF